METSIKKINHDLMNLTFLKLNSILSRKVFLLILLLGSMQEILAGNDTVLVQKIVRNDSVFLEFNLKYYSSPYYKYDSIFAYVGSQQNMNDIMSAKGKFLNKYIPCSAVGIDFGAQGLQCIEPKRDSIFDANGVCIGFDIYLYSSFELYIGNNSNIGNTSLTLFMKPKDSQAYTSKQYFYFDVITGLIDNQCIYYKQDGKLNILFNTYIPSAIVNIYDITGHLIYVDQLNNVYPGQSICIADQLEDYSIKILTIQNSKNTSTHVFY